MRYVSYRDPRIQFRKPTTTDECTYSAKSIFLEPPRLGRVCKAVRQAELWDSSGNNIYSGPDPYVDYNRRFTAEDGIAITYKTVDESGWRTALRIVVLLAVMALAATYLAKASPYPMLPYGCPVFGRCPFPMRWDRYWVDIVLLAGFGVVCACILFVEVQVYREIEIRADCMILDGGEVFWAEKFELGLPQFLPGEEGMHTLTGVYGTRLVEFLKVKAFDENDRGPAVFAAHLAAAMQQQWSQGA